MYHLLSTFLDSNLLDKGISLMKSSTNFPVICSLALLIGCSKKDADASKDTGARMLSVKPSSSAPVDLTGKPLSVGGIVFVPPSSWRDMGGNAMRACTYVMDPIEGEPDSATVAVSFFGTGQGGPVDMNIKRWISQVSLPDGGDASSIAETSTLTVDGMPAHYVSVAGTFNASMGGPMAPSSGPNENYRLIGYIIETPQGSVFFKLVGPLKTASEMGGALTSAIGNIKKG
jgi:hypothetical protein